jgi:phosphopantothenoylcysteine decarboxylase/phosphopantothenate--cysteine ligase
MDLSGKHLVLGLSGGIACYKSAELCRGLIKAGATVQVVMTEAAERFITPVTMQALSGRAVYGSQWDAREGNNMPHINLSREADAIAIAPCSADFVARLAQGRADELLSLLCLARPSGLPLLLAPAMNREMWAHPATQRNLAQVRADGAVVLGVGTGAQACGETGDGRMLEPDELLEDIAVHLRTDRPLAGRRVLITAGPTFEAIDPVRGITNHSSGKMGFAIARAARAAGAEVVLVAGPVALATPRGVRRIDVQSALQMQAAVQAEADAADVFVAAAAVADWRPARAHDAKIKKDGSGRPPALEFVENPDILHGVARSPRARSGALYCVGFAAETHDLEIHAAAKRLRKGVPLLVGNIGPAAFGRDDNQLLLVDADGARPTARAPKEALATELVAEIARRMPARTGFDTPDFQRTIAR